MANQITHKDVTFHVGDTISVSQKIQEGDKFRIQLFDGIVIAISKNGDPTFTVRKIATGQIAVEKIFPLNATVIDKIVVKRSGDVRQAKLYYLRDRIGKKATKVKEK
ncbi:MAG: 50S ribosomal protein L19 [bacterium]